MGKNIFCIFTRNCIDFLNRNIRVACRRIKYTCFPHKDCIEFIKGITGKSLQHQSTIEDYLNHIKVHYENIISNIPGHVYWFDLNNVFLGCNEEHARNVGLSSKEEIVGKTNFDMPWKSSAKYLNKINMQVANEKKPVEAEESGYIASGRFITMLTKKAPLFDANGQVIGVVGVSLDITDKILAEKKLQDANIREKQQEERIHVLQSIGFSLAHELRTPLGAIQGYASEDVENYSKILYEGYNLAKENKLPVKFIQPHLAQLVKSSFHDIRDVTTRANKFIDMLLAYVRSQASDNDSAEIDSNSFEVCSVSDCVNNAIKQYPFIAPEDKKLLKWENKIDFKAQGSPILIEHILFNLIRNAIYYVKAAEKGSISIESKPGKKVNALIVKDTGQGIPEDVLERIFDDFYSTRDNGIGIGLAYCRWAMRAMKGEITCNSKFGEFTEFVLTFPITQLF